MKPLFITFTVLLFSLSAVGAKNNDHWYKVESKKSEKKKKTIPFYPYDSLEKGASKQSFKEIGFWSLRPKLGLSGGFHADRSLFSDHRLNRFFLNTSLQFRTRPTHRLTANAQLLLNNSMFIGGSWEFTPSRKRTRTYYGGGIAHKLVSNKQFSNLVEGESYYVTAQYGWEMLKPSGNGWTIEVKGFLSSADRAIQLSWGYLLPF